MVPVTPAALALEGARAIAAGADALHLHVRGADGMESLAGDEVTATLETVRAACRGIPIGISSGSWIEPDPLRRLDLVNGWEVLPDFVSVNMDEPGAVDLCALLLKRGIGIEPGLSEPGEVAVLAQSGLAGSALRLLIEPVAAEPVAALAAAAAVLDALDAAGIAGPRLLHGTEAAAWSVLDRAVVLGYQSRIGFEDTLTLPDGSVADSNEALVRAARERESATAAQGDGR